MQQGIYKLTGEIKTVPTFEVSLGINRPPLSITPQLQAEIYALFVQKGGKFSDAVLKTNGTYVSKESLEAAFELYRQARKNVESSQSEVIGLETANIWDIVNRNNTINQI
ncbi:MAG: hypothetical protein WC004_00100 [Candidatus Absconditabacterales bacterium]